ncbi:DUF397 domain-containing protein [Streptomyces halstedii]|uniref:DUF397 domain-containing protein n=1 Tax=Streptomyces halstedii TaxID=1944 RepID=UPI0027E0BAE8|nr:DUF397 domain-containing protein [Streptomyces halstedii]
MRHKSVTVRLVAVRGEHCQGDERVSEFHFEKSSYSEPNGECVEVARNIPRLVAVRDSKQSEGPVFMVASASWALFLAHVRQP